MRPARKWLMRAAVLVPALILFAYAVAWWVLSNLSIMTHGSVDLGQGNIRIPAERTRTWAERSPLLDSVFADLARKHDKKLQFGNKEVDPLIAQLAAGRNIGPVNRILREARPWGEVGSHHDYDFTLCGLTLMLYHFGGNPKLLYPETVNHIVGTLLTEKGGKPATHPVVRRFPPLKFLPLKDTENHILMTEGSRFLTNQWIANHGSTDPVYDNTRNGLEDWLLTYLDGFEKAGVHEYNAIPYEGYTLRGLLNLASFAEGPVAKSAVRVLDRMNWTYALGSLSLRRYAPFRRLPARASLTRLDAHYQTAMMKAWMSLAGVEHLEIRQAPQHAMWIGLTTYRPPDAVVDWVMSKPADYFVRIGHGSDGSPEIYSGGPGYLITAGGVANAILRDNVARPTTLMLEDGASDLSELLHLQGPGPDYHGWNNTGVHRRFAVAAGPVHVPESWKPSIETHGWAFYQQAGKRIAVHSSHDFGLFCLLPDDGDFATQAPMLAAANADPSQLRHTFQWPDGPRLTYDVTAGKGDWVMVSENGKTLDRAHATWPLMAGELPD